VPIIDCRLSQLANARVEFESGEWGPTIINNYRCTEMYTDTIA